MTESDFQPHQFLRNLKTYCAAFDGIHPPPDVTAIFASRRPNSSDKIVTLICTLETCSIMAGKIPLKNLCWTEEEFEVLRHCENDVGRRKLMNWWIGYLQRNEVARTSDFSNWNVKLSCHASYHATAGDILWIVRFRDV